MAAISESDIGAHRPRRPTPAPSLIGKLGVEAAYEKELHGTNGFREVLVNAQGRSVTKIGQLTPDLKVRAPSPGDDLMLSIDMPTQRAAEEMLEATSAARLVAIDPQTGDVLALVSRPGFDPNLFGRGLTRAEFKALNDNIDHPLLNRALRGQYPSGSTIKPAIALAGARLPTTSNPDATQLLPRRVPPARQQPHVPRRPHRPSRRDGSAPCDRQVLRRVLLRSRERDRRGSTSPSFLAPLGFGSLTGIDISGEKPGLLPSREWKKQGLQAARRADLVPRRDGELRYRPGLLPRRRRCSSRTTPRFSRTAALLISRAS